MISWASAEKATLTLLSGVASQVNRCRPLETFQTRHDSSLPLASHRGCQVRRPGCGSSPDAPREGSEAALRYRRPISIRWNRRLRWRANAIRVGVDEEADLAGVSARNKVADMNNELGARSSQMSASVVDPPAKCQDSCKLSLVDLTLVPHSISLANAGSISCFSDYLIILIY
jgi:hypothetical protein